MPVIVEVQLRNGRIVEIEFPHRPTPDEVERAALEIERQLGITPPPPPPKPQPTQAQQLAGALRGTLQRGWNWLRSKLGLKSPEERAAEIAGPALAKHPEALQEMARIEAARRQASSVPAMLRDAAIAPGNLAAERRYGSALQRQGAQANTGSQMDQVGVVGQLGNLLGLPQRGAVAWAKQVASKRGAKGSKYADSGEAFMDAAEWGALLEDLAPFLPKPVRQALAVPMDIVLDPLLLVPPAKVAGVLAPIASKLPGAARAKELAQRGQYALLKWLHPTTAAALETLIRQTAREYGISGSDVWDLTNKITRDPMITWLDLYNIGGKNLLQLLKRSLEMANVEFAGASPREFPMTVVSAPTQHMHPAAMAEALDALRGSVAAILRELEANRGNGNTPELIQLLLENAISLLERPRMSPDEIPLMAGFVEAMRRWAVDREVPSDWQRALGWWKRSVTSFNLPAGAVRNFFGNFLAQYLAGEPLKLSPRPFAELLKEAFGTTKFTRAGDIGADVLRRGEPPKQAMARVAQTIADTAGEIYSGADKLAAAVLAKISDKPVEHFLIGESFRLPERIEWLSRVGLVPFASWPTFIAPRLARGFMENPARWHRLAMALQAGGVRESDNNLYIPLQDNKALNVEPFLPISPYMLSASEGDLPELLARWPAISFARDITDALAGAPAKPAALSTTSPIANAAITALNYALPPSFWNALRLAKPEWFADIPRSPLSKSDYLLRLLGMGVIRNPEQYAAIRRRRELEKLRRLMRRVGVRATQMNEQTGE